MSGGGKAKVSDPFDDIPDAFADIPDVEPAAAPEPQADAEGFKPSSGPEQIPLEPVSAAVASKAPAKPPADDEKTGMFRGFLNTVGQGLSDLYHYPETHSMTDLANTLGDAAYNVAGGAYSGLGMHPARVAETIAGPKAGDAVREQLAVSRARSPALSGIGQVGGEIASGSAVLGPIAEAAPIIGSAALGGLSAMGNVDTGDWDERLQALKEGVTTGTIFGSLGKAGEKGLNYLGTKGADALRSSGLLNRVAATGAYGGDLKKLIQKANVPSRAKQALEDLGQWIEEKGIHVGEGPLGFLPQPAKTYTKNAEAVNAAAGAQRQAVLNALKQNPVGVNAAPIAQELEAGAQKLGGMSDEIAEAGTQAQQKAQMAQGIRNKTLGPTAPNLAGGEMQFEDALARREKLDSLINHYKPASSTGDSLREEVNRDVGNAYRGALQDALDQKAPALGQQWRGAQGDLSQGLEVQKLGAAREAKELGNQVLSLPTIIAGSGALGAGVGMYGGGDAGDNTAAGLGTAALVGTAAALAKSRGHAGMAGVQKLGSQIARKIGQAAPYVAPAAGAGAVVVGGNRGEAMTPRIDDMAAPAPATASGRGNLLPDAAMTILGSNPSQLGKYQAQFFEAYNGKDPNAVASLIARLTQNDPEFRRAVLPQLQRMTVNAGGGR